VVVHWYQKTVPQELEGRLLAMAFENASLETERLAYSHKEELRQRDAEEGRVIRPNDR